MYLVGIAGGSGSGKTTFAHKVLKLLGPENAQILSMDSYYLHKLPKDLTTPSGRLNFDHPHAFDWKLLREHLVALKDGNEVQTPIYDFKSNSRVEEYQLTKPTKIILFEGIFSLFDLEIRANLDIKCFLHVDSDMRFSRRLHRDVKERNRSLESVIDQYYESVRPMYQKYLDPQKQHADFTVGEETDVAAHILAARLKEYLND